VIPGRSLFLTSTRRDEIHCVLLKNTPIPSGFGHLPLSLLVFVFPALLFSPFPAPFPLADALRIVCATKTPCALTNVLHLRRDACEAKGVICGVFRVLLLAFPLCLRSYFFCTSLFAPPHLPLSSCPVVAIVEINLQLANYTEFSLLLS